MYNVSTEELVRLMLKENLDGKEILDIGTGSGCIAISLAKNLPNSKVTALDISKVAIEVAKENAKLNNVNIEFINADIFEYRTDKKYDVIVSNPPYVLESEKSLMKKNVLDFEPELALFVDDNNSLKYYRSILNMSKNNLKKSGTIFFEINRKLTDQMKKLIKNYDYQSMNFILDLDKKKRFLKFMINNV